MPASIGGSHAPLRKRRQDTVVNGLISQRGQMGVGFAQGIDIVFSAFGHGPAHARRRQGHGHSHHDIVKSLGIEIGTAGPIVGLAQNTAQHKNALLCRRLKRRTPAQIDNASTTPAYVFLNASPFIGTQANAIDRLSIENIRERTCRQSEYRP